LFSNIVCPKQDKRETKMRISSKTIAVLCAAVLTACSAGQFSPTPSPQDQAAAKQIFDQERANPTSFGNSSQSQARARYARVIARVEPAAEQYCRSSHGGSFDCDVQIRVDSKATVRNAYQFYDQGRPVVVVTMPLMTDVRNDDELAFVIGHEFGHHIAQHIVRQEKTAKAAAVLVAAAGAYAVANSNNASNSDKVNAVLLGGTLGYAVGQRAFSQSHELEADTLGTYVSKIAGYDPINGARYFARPEATRKADGSLSFWGTHPPDEKRIATVLAASRLYDSHGGQ
jgi:Zn-dependent protease with chaperone function